jgi:hypothetical protein
VLIGVGSVLRDQAQDIDSRADLVNIVVNTLGLVFFSTIFIWDKNQASVRVERRAAVRKAQLKFGDRCAAIRVWMF